MFSAKSIEQMHINEQKSKLLDHPDKHKTNLPERRSLPFWEVWLKTSAQLLDAGQELIIIYKTYNL
jgi:hypothetical protein